MLAFPRVFPMRSAVGLPFPLPPVHPAQQSSERAEGPPHRVVGEESERLSHAVLLEVRGTIAVAEVHDDSSRLLHSRKVRPDSRYEAKSSGVICPDATAATSDRRASR